VYTEKTFFLNSLLKLEGFWAPFSLCLISEGFCKA